MCYKEALEIVSNSAAILTAAVATIAYVKFIREQKAHRVALEDYLREEKLKNNDHGQRTVIHLMGNLGMTDTEVLKAGFQSKKIKTAAKSGDQGFADGILFEYTGSDILPPQKF